MSPRNKWRFAAGPLRKQELEPWGQAHCWEHTLCGHLGTPTRGFVSRLLALIPGPRGAAGSMEEGVLPDREGALGRAGSPQHCAAIWDDRTGRRSGNWGCWGKCGAMDPGQRVVRRTQAGRAISETKELPRMSTPSSPAMCRSLLVSEGALDL